MAILKILNLVKLATYLDAQYVGSRIKTKYKHMSRKRHTVSIGFYGKRNIPLAWVRIHCESETEKKDS